MANRIVRSIRQIENINDQPLNTTEENDILSDKENNVYVRTPKGYSLINGGGQDFTNDIKNLKSENTKLKNRVSTLETDYADLLSRVTNLETPTE